MKNPALNALSITSVILFTSLLPGSASGQTIGTLFTTAEERIYLDNLRNDYLDRSTDSSFDLSSAVSAPEVHQAEILEPVIPEITIYQLGAIISHADGRTTILLNDAIMEETGLPVGTSLIMTESGAALTITTRNTSYTLKPGQRLDTVTGTVTEMAGE